MLVWVKAHLIDLQSLSVVFVIEFAQQQDTGRRLVGSKNVEVQQYHLSVKIGQVTHLAFVVGQCNIYKTSLLHLAGINRTGLVGIRDADILHTLNGYIVQVLATFGVGPVSIPAGSNGSKHLDVVSVALRIKEQHVAQSLEQGKIGGSLGRVREDILALHLVLVLTDHREHAVVHLVDSQRLVAAHLHGTLL